MISESGTSWSRLPYERFFSLRVDHIVNCERAALARKANRKQPKIFPFVKKVGKYGSVPIHFKHRRLKLGP